MTAGQYRRQVQRLTRKNKPKCPHGHTVDHIVPVSWCIKHRDKVSATVASDPVNLKCVPWSDNVGKSNRITRASLMVMRKRMPLVDPENAEWWRDKADFHESRMM